MVGGRVFIGLLLIISILGVLITGASVYSRLLYLGLLFLFSNWLWAKLSLQKIRVKRKARLLRGNVGDFFEEHFEIINYGMIGCVWVGVQDLSTLPHYTGSRLLTSVGKKQIRSYNARTWLIKRGRYSLGPTILLSGDPFGLFQSKRKFPAKESLIVIPMIIDIIDYPTPPGLLPGGKPISRKSLDITPHASGVREYIMGDPTKRIHWPMTVRYRKLMVKEFDQDPQAEIWLFLDAESVVHYEMPFTVPAEKLGGWLSRKKPTFPLPPSTLEYAITITASLTHFFIKNNWSVGLAVSSKVPSVIPADRSDRQEVKILEMLALIEAEGKIPFSNWVFAQANQLAGGSTVILITPSTDTDLLSVVDYLLRRNYNPMVILIIADTFNGHRGSDLLAEKLLKNNIPTVSIKKDSDLAQELSIFSTKYMINIPESQRFWTK